jgi:hypothetical protein
VEKNEFSLKNLPINFHDLQSHEMEPLIAPQEPDQVNALLLSVFERVHDFMMAS